MTLKQIHVGKSVVSFALISISVVLCPGTSAQTPTMTPPACTPAANKIVFDGYPDEETAEEIFTMNGEGENIMRLTNNTVEDFNPEWSPDETRIAFVSNRDGNYEIYTMNTDGTGVLRLTTNNVPDGDPVWSSDGMKIAFISQRSGDNDIYTMNPDGSNLINITNNPSNDIYPAWSPDGTKFAFASNRDGNYEIYTMSSTGRYVTRLTSNSVDAFYNDLSWSPNDRIIAFRGKHEDIYRVNIDGTGFTNITNTKLDTGGFIWLSDNDHIVFVTTVEGLVSIRIDGTDRSPLDIPLPDRFSSFDASIKQLCGFI